MKRAGVRQRPLTIPQRLEQRRKDLGDPSYEKVTLRVYSLLGERHTPSKETIRNMHIDGTHASNNPDPIVLGALCEVYGLQLRDVSPETADFLELVQDRIPAWCGMVPLSDQATRITRWESDTQSNEPPTQSDDLRLFPLAS